MRHFVSAIGATTLVSLTGSANANFATPNAFVSGGTIVNGQTGPSGFAQRDASIISSSANVIQARYAWGLMVDPDGVNNSTSGQTINASSRWTLNFDVTNAGPWSITVDQSRIGAITTDAENDDDLSAQLGPSALTALSGATLQSGTMSLAPVSLGPVNFDLNQNVNQSASAVISGTGPSSVSMTFEWNNYVDTDASFFSSPGGIALRFGRDTAFSGSNVGAYPGPGGRLIGDDGHFVTLTLVPAPGSLAVLAVGGLLLRRRR